jgi:hypothetical protein
LPALHELLWSFGTFDLAEDVSSEKLKRGPWSQAHLDPSVYIVPRSHTLAADLDHIGIICSSVNRFQISSAEACSVALTSTVATLLTFDPDPEAEADAEGFSALASDAVLAGGAGA